MSRARERHTFYSLLELITGLIVTLILKSRFSLALNLFQFFRLIPKTLAEVVRLSYGTQNTSFKLCNN